MNAVEEIRRRILRADAHMSEGGPLGAAAWGGKREGLTEALQLLEADDHYKLGKSVHELTMAVLEKNGMLPPKEVPS